MADWSANTDFAAPRATREPVLRSRRDSEAHAAGLRAEPRASRPAEEAAPLSPGVAALAQYNAGQGGPLAKAGLAVWAGGGVLSLLLLGGVAIWGYKLVLREVMGLPVVAAEEGPMRVLPAQPQGEVVPSQGLAVNAIPGAGTAAPPSDVLVLAPQTAGLAEEDMVVVQTRAEAGEVMPAATPVVSAVATDPLALVEAGAQPLAAAAAAVAVPPAPALALTPATVAPAPAVAPATVAGAAASPERHATLLVASPTPADGATAAQQLPTAPAETASVPQPLSPAVSAATAPTAPAAPAVAVVPAAQALVAPPAVATALPASPAVAATALAAAPAIAAPALPEAALQAALPPVVARVRPLARPAAPALAEPAAPVAALPAAPEEPAAAAAVVAAPAPSAAPTAALPAGTSLVQLGAFDSPEIAAAEWTRLQGRFGEFLGGRERVIQETQSNGRTFYRLRAMGFADRAEARVLCAALTAEDAACIPVTAD